MIWLTNEVGHQDAPIVEVSPPREADAGKRVRGPDVVARFGQSNTSPGVITLSFTPDEAEGFANQLMQAVANAREMFPGT